MELSLTKRQQEIFEFIKQLLGRARLSADGARHRQGDRADVVVHGPRPPRRTSRSSASSGAIPRSRARSRSWSTRPRTCVAPRGLPLVGQVAAGAPILAEENVEDYVELPADRGWRRRRVHPAREGRLDAGRRHPRRGSRGRAASRRPRRNGEIVVALVGEEATVGGATSRRRTTSASSRRTTPTSRSARATRRCWVASWASVAGCVT